MSKRRIAFVVPAHNEQEVITHTLKSLLLVTKKQNIFVVTDGSSDNSAAIARGYTANVLELKTNVGKAEAINTAIQYFNLETQYIYLMPIDADTQVTEDFVQKTTMALDKDVDKQYSCAVGRVAGRGYNWITMYRQWEYEVGQTIHKQAQAYENAVTVLPGCATVYRASVFKNLRIPSGTMTEDMDLTFLLHRMGKGKFIYVNNASVYTQDPRTLKDFAKQINRWYTGFWQCVIKHDIPWGGQALDFEVALLALEGIFNGFAVILMILLFPVLAYTKPQFVLYPLAVDLVLFMIPTLLYTMIKHRMWTAFLYLPLFYLMRLLSSLIFLKSFLNIFTSRDLYMHWIKVQRYQIIES